MNVIIDGIEYVPRAEILPLNDEQLQACLESLTEIQYFSEETHKHRAWAWDALNAISPDLAALPPEVAFERIHGR